jgi:iron complex outermembrane receptor protein
MAVVSNYFCGKIPAPGRHRANTGNHTIGEEIMRLSNVRACLTIIAIFMNRYPCLAGPDADKVTDSSLLVLDKSEVTATRGDVLQTVTGEQSRIVDPAQISVVKAINLVPSLSQQSVDPCGIADISNYHESFRFRGVEATAGGVPASPVNVEDVPVSGRPGGGPSIYDLENFRDILIYTGGLPADKGCGIADVGGKINMTILRPRDTFELYAKQALGTLSLDSIRSHDYFRRTFVRLNSGSFFNTKGFLSYSNTYADKWKGEGHTNRNNAMFGITSSINERTTLEVFGIYNNLKLNIYRPLSFAQISDMNAYYNYDFSNDRNDYYYYDYNRNEFEDYMVLAKASVKINEQAGLSFKPYFWNDAGYYLETITQPNGQNRVRRWDLDHDLYGGLLDFSGEIAAVHYRVGYLYHNQQRPGPPTSWKTYKLSSGGLVFDKYNLLSNDSRYELNSPLVTASYSAGPFSFDGGLRYVHFKLPAIITYKADSTWGDIGHEEALDRDPPIDNAASAKDPKMLDGLFPNVTVRGKANDRLAVYGTYGRNYVTHVDIYPYFISQRGTFQQAGITFDRLWKDREMEYSHNIELGARYETEKLVLAPAAYYSIHQNKQAVLYDPALGATYPRNDANATGYGSEIEAKANPFDCLVFYGSLSYNRFYFTQDINSDKDASTLRIKNNQVPDAPRFLAKALLTYRMEGLSVSPIVRYASKRYGDVLHNEKINGSTAFDMDFSYTRSLAFLKNIEMTATFMNILNRKDVALINTSDYKTLKTSYQPVAPFTIMGSVAVTY